MSAQMINISKSELEGPCAGCGETCGVDCPEAEYCLGRKQWSCGPECRDDWGAAPCGHKYDNGDDCFCAVGSESHCAECLAHIDDERVTIYCLRREGEEMTVCGECWDSGKKEFKAEGWYDQNADSDDEEDDE